MSGGCTTNCPTVCSAHVATGPVFVVRLTGSDSFALDQTDDADDLEHELRAFHGRAAALVDVPGHERHLRAPRRVPAPTGANGVRPRARARSDLRGRRVRRRAAR